MVARKALGLALVACTMGAVFAENTELVAYYTFDDAANPLAATVGTAATVVNYTRNSVTAVEGLGDCAFVTDPAVTSGLADGSGALTVPLGQALRIAHGLPTDMARPWCLSMRVYVPENPATSGDALYNSLLTTFQNGEGDAALCIKKFDEADYRIGGGNDDAQNWGYRSISAGAWHVITVSLGPTLVELYIDGMLTIQRSCGVSDIRSGRWSLKDRPYLFVAGDESGEDSPLHFDWVKVYNVARPQELFFRQSQTGMTVHYTFDDASNPLAAAVGPAATVVNYTKNSVTVAEGLGDCALVTDPTITAGLESGSGALTIPLGQALRIEHGISTLKTQPWCISMRVYLPQNTSSTAYNSLLTTFQNGEGDAALCIRKFSETDYGIGGGDNSVTSWGYTSLAYDAWHVITVSCDDYAIRLIVDGVVIQEKASTVAEMRSGRMTLLNRPYLFISGDESGEDAPLHFDWIKVYNTSVPDDLVVKTAFWSGGGDVTNPLDALNWTVLDENNATVVRGVPDVFTEIVLGSGTTSLNVPRANGFRCGRVRLDGTVTLTDAADWRGLGMAPFVGHGTLDLNGHQLSVSSLRGAESGMIDVVNNASGDPVEFRVDVPEGFSERNENLVIGGNLTLVKGGPGTLVSSGYHIYSGGTHVAAGCFMCGLSPAQGVCGRLGTLIVVDADAVFDLWGFSALENYVVTLNGGTLTSTRNASVASQDWTLGDLSLTADSRIAFADYGAKVEISHDVRAVPGSTWDLGGHILDMTFAGYDPDFYSTTDKARQLVLSNGTIRTSGSGWFHDYGISGRDGGCLDLDNILRLQLKNASEVSDIQDFTVRDTYTTSNVGSTGRLRVWGTFTPLSRYCFQVELENGAALNLAEHESDWPIAFENGVVTAFATGAEITLKLGERKFREPTRVVAWTSAPSNLASLTFKVEEPLQEVYGVAVREDGVYVWPRQGIVVIVK